MINVIFWGIVFLIIMFVTAEGDGADIVKFILFFGMCISMVIYGIYSDSVALVLIFGTPIAGVVLALCYAKDN